MDSFAYLQELGLSRQEAKLITALYAIGEVSAKGLSEASGIPYTKIYESLNPLEKRGIVMHTPGRPKLYKAIEPDSLIALLIKDKKSSVELIENKREEIVGELGSIEKRVTSTDETGIWVIGSTAGFWEKLLRIANSVKKSFNVVAPSHIYYDLFQQPDIPVAFYDAVMKRKIRIRAIFGKSFSAKQIVLMGIRYGWFFKRANWFGYLGAPNFEQRVIPDEQILNPFVLFDDKEANIGIILPKKIYKSIVIRNRDIVKSMHQHFEILWKTAEPVGLGFANIVARLSRKK